jgi:hypothetical protein
MLALSRATSPDGSHTSAGPLASPPVAQRMDFGKPRTPSRRSGVLGQRHRTGELREVERYVREADQAKMAGMGMKAVTGAFGGASRT